MANVKWCAICCHSDPNREEDGKIRCKKKSKWVDQHDTCEQFSYTSANNVDMNALRRILDGKNH